MEAAAIVNDVFEVKIPKACPICSCDCPNFVMDESKNGFHCRNESICRLNWAKHVYDV